MNIKINKIDSLFYIAYGIILTFSILNTSFYAKYFQGTVYKIIFILCSVLLVCNELKKKFNVKEIIGSFILILCLSLMIFVSTGTNQYLVASSLLYIFCARNIDFIKIAKFTVVLETLILFLVITSAYTGVIENYIYESKGRIREYLGFRYALYPSTYMFNITGLYIYIRKSNIRWRECMVLILLNYWFFVKTDSRMTFGLTILLVLVSLTMKYRKDILKKGLITGAMTYSFLICALISIYLTIAYNSNISWMYKLNYVLGGRLRLGHLSLMENGVSLFGQKIYWTGSGLDVYGNISTGTYNFVDSFYIQVVQRYGILFFLILIIVLTATLSIVAVKKEWYMLVIFSTIAVHCIIDDLSMYFYYNTFWLVIGSTLMHSSKQIYKRIEAIS